MTVLCIFLRDACISCVENTCYTEDEVMKRGNLLDIKAIDEQVHIACTGASNRRILENIRYIDTLGIPFEVRYPYVPTQTDGEWGSTPVRFKSTQEKISTHSLASPLGERWHAKRDGEGVLLFAIRVCVAILSTYRVWTYTDRSFRRAFVRPPGSDSTFDAPPCR